MRESGYDKLAEDSQRAFENLTDEISRNTELQNQIIKNMLSKASSNYQAAYNIINSTIQKNGLVFSEVTDQEIAKIDKIGTAMSAMVGDGSIFGDADSETFTGAASLANAALIDITTEAQNVANKINQTDLSEDNLFKDIMNAANDVVESLDMIITKINKINTTKIGSTTHKSNDDIQIGKEVGTPDANSTPHTTQNANKQSEVIPVKLKAKPATTTAKPTTTTKKFKVTDAQAKNAVDYIMKNLKYKKKQGDWENSINKPLWKHSDGIDRRVIIPEEVKKEAFKKLGSPGGEYNKDKLKTALVNTGIWDLLKEVRTVPTNKDATKANIQKPLYNGLDVYGYYAKGSKNIPKKQLAWTQEKGQELIYRRSDGAVLTPLNKGDKVFTAEMTENLWKIAKGMNVDVGRSVIDSNAIINNKPIINMSGMDNSIIIQGNADQNTVDQIRKIMDSRLDKFTKDLTKDFSMFGNKIRF